MLYFQRIRAIIVLIRHPSRLFYNPLHADARKLFGEQRVKKAAAAAGVETLAQNLEQSSLIDWPQSTRVKLSIIRRLFEDFSATDLRMAPATALAMDFASFRAAGGKLLEDQARFEALHAQMLSADRSGLELVVIGPDNGAIPTRADVKSFAERKKDEVAFYCFLQWIADRSIAAAQREAETGPGCASGCLPISRSE